MRFVATILLVLGLLPTRASGPSQYGLDLKLCMEKLAVAQAMTPDRLKELKIPMPGSPEAKALTLQSFAEKLRPLIIERVVDMEHYVRTYFRMSTLQADGTHKRVVDRPEDAEFAKAVIDEQFRKEFEKKLAENYAGGVSKMFDANTDFIRGLKVVLEACGRLGGEDLESATKKAIGSLTDAENSNPIVSGLVEQDVRMNLASDLLSGMKADRYSKPDGIELSIQGYVAGRVREQRKAVSGGAAHSSGSGTNKAPHSRGSHN